MAVHPTAWRTPFSVTFALALALSVLEELPLHGQEVHQTGFSTTVRPLLVARCFGCHQTARPGGGYVMTDFAKMVAGGDSGTAVVPGDPDASYLMEMITPEEGKAQMPPDSPPLAENEIAAIRDWIAGGAINDSTTQHAVYSSESPPQYHRQPVITTLAVSPDGNWLAASGYHEVLVYDVRNLVSGTLQDGAAELPVARRLTGMSSRIESIRFSPDGSQVAVAGGVTGEFGEVQVWSLADGKLTLSKVFGDDTLDGINWSPDGKLISFGGKDNILRSIDASTGAQVLFQRAHEDWIADTVFSVDGTQLVSVARDMTCKLTEVPTQRFIDNVTSITPGVLKGGISSVARHPQRDEVVIGGADGVVKVYRMNRITKRVIGDDANLVRLMPSMPGRINSVAVSPDGKRIAAASSLNGRGFVRVFSYEFDPAVSEPLKAILAKLPENWTAEERKTVDEYNRAGVRLISSLDIGDSAMYALDFLGGSGRVVAGGTDGRIHVIDCESGSLLAAIPTVPVSPSVVEHQNDNPWLFERPSSPNDVDANSTSATSSSEDLDEVSPTTTSLVSHRKPASLRALRVSPEGIDFRSPLDYAQLVVTAEFDDGTESDVTHEANIQADSDQLHISGSLVQPLAPHNSNLTVSWSGVDVQVPVSTSYADERFVPDFSRDVNPVLTRLGCNAGTCHGSAGGKQGFKLSLRGYDNEFDIRALTDDNASRRVNVAWPVESLMLRKPAGMVAHSGGKLLDEGGRYFNLVREWIAGGSLPGSGSPRVASLKVVPPSPVLPDSGSRQQFRVMATYQDGTTRDVTREVFLEIGNTEIATVEGSVVTATRRGETAVLARYDGAYAAAVLTVMGNREGFVWTEPESWTEIDRLVADKWERMKIIPSGLCTDEEFVRRLYLDLTGLPPSVEQVQAFVNDKGDTRAKRDALVDQLVGNSDYVEHWSSKWADLLQVNSKYLGPEGAASFRNWIREQVRINRPYDEFVRDILTANGSNKDSPQASYFKIHRTPVDTMENTTHLFLATRFNCNKCHDHPFERWTQDQYFETAAWFSEVSLQPDAASGERTIGGSAVEGATPLFEIVGDNGSGKMIHDRTGGEVSPGFPYEVPLNMPADATRRQQLAAWITSPDNASFASSYVNRLWGYLLGTGLIEPLDDIRAGNPPTNPELLKYLTTEFLDSGFDVQHIVRQICKSRVYQLSLVTNPLNEDDQINYSHARPRRLPAEVLYDAIHFVTGSSWKLPGLPEGTRAASLPDANVPLPGGFLATLGRPPRESACECERSSEMQLTSVLAMVSGPDVSHLINSKDNSIAKLVETETDDRRLIEQIFLRVLNRAPRGEELESIAAEWSKIPAEHETLVGLRDQRKAEVEQLLPELERQRQEAIETTRRELDERIAAVDPELLKKEAAHAEGMAAATRALEEYEKGEKGFEGWKRKQLREIHWSPLGANEFRSEAGRTGTPRQDRSVLVSRPEGIPGKKDIYTLVTATDLAGITAVRLELLPDDLLPGKGPGLAPNGNLVLTELQLEIAHPDRPDEWIPAPFSTAVANFEQGSFAASQAIDGEVDNRGGWALMGNIGVSNWAVFQLKMPTGFSGGTLIRFRMHQNFDDNHQIGCFRISLTCHDGPIGLGLDEALLAELRKNLATTDEKVTSALRTAFRRSDAEFVRLEEYARVARQPLPVDPGIVALRERLARVSLPLPADLRLSQLEADVAASESQLKSLRLTEAQDLVWALVNSPAFLFNH